MTSWRNAALARGWIPSRLDAFESGLVARGSMVVYVDADVIAIHTTLGSLQRETLRPDVATIARANAATAHMPGWIVVGTSLAALADGHVFAVASIMTPITPMYMLVDRAGEIREHDHETLCRNYRLNTSREER